MIKADIINEVAVQTGFDKATVRVIFEAITANVKQSLADGENVYLRGFGSFVTKSRAAKMARNITTNSTVKVPAHRVPYFKPAAEFKAMVR